MAHEGGRVETEVSTGTILFDLGGVLADLSNPVEAMDLAMTDEDFWSIWLNSSNVYALETGTLTAADFCENFGRELADLEGTFSEDRLRSWNITLYPGAEQLLRALAKNNSLSLLSNTNAVHWQQVVSSTQVFSQFEHTFLSYETGLYKPLPSSFQDVLNTIDENPEDILYFDDTPKNVSAAARMGLNAHLVTGIEQLEEALTQELIK
jgi:HAD superfamily hydrolase (TIGR01509 family)